MKENNKISLRMLIHLEIDLLIIKQMDIFSLNKNMISTCLPLTCLTSANTLGLLS